MEKFIIYTDGGARGNPGPAAIGVVICNEKNQAIKRYGEYLGDNLTNNQAEYKAIIFALKKIKALVGKKRIRNIDIEIRSDSELVINQIKGRYKILEKELQPLFLELWNLKVEFPHLKFLAVPREKNKLADRLVNETLDARVKMQKLNI